MYNKIILVGTVDDSPVDSLEVSYDLDGDEFLRFSLKVPPPPDAPCTHWRGIYNLRTPDKKRPVGDDNFMIICRDHVLIEKCVSSLKKGDIVCVEGRLTLTELRVGYDDVPLVEILAHDIVAITEIPKISSQGA